MQAIPFRENTIGDIRLKVRPMGGMRALRFEARCAKFLRAAAEAAAKVSRDKGDSNEMLLVAGAAYLSGVTPDEIEAITRELLGDGLADWGLGDRRLFGEGIGPNAGCFDEITAGRAELSWQILSWAVEINFGNFTGLVKRGLAKVGVQVKGAPPDASSSSAPTSTSGQASG